MTAVNHYFLVLTDHKSQLFKLTLKLFVVHQRLRLKNTLMIGVWNIFDRFWSVNTEDFLEHFGEQFLVFAADPVTEVVEKYFFEFLNFDDFINWNIFILVAVQLKNLINLCESDGNVEITLIH